MSNPIPLRFDEWERERAEKNRQAPRNGVSDKTPTTNKGQGLFQRPSLGGMAAAVGRDVGKLGQVPKRVADLGARAAQGASGGWVDEWAGGFVNPSNPAAGAQTMRDRFDQIDEDMPVLGQGAEVLGAISTTIVPGAGGARATQLATRIPGFLRGAAGAAAGGAVTAAGMSEGDAADRGLAALGGGTAGAILGGLGQGALRAGQFIKRSVSRSPKAAERAATHLMDDLLAQSGRSTDDVASEVGRLRGEGYDARLVDALGQKGGRRLGVVQSRTGAMADDIAETMVQRQRDLPEKLSDQLAAAAGRGERPNAIEMAEDIIARRRAQADEMYPAVFAKGTKVDNPEVLAQFRKPEMRAIYERAQANARLADEAPLPQLYDEAGDLIGVPDIRTIDAVKRLGIDDAISQANRETGKGSAQVRGWHNVKNKLLAAADEADPDYAEARRVFAGESEMLEALGKGKGVSSKTSKAMQAEMKDLSEAELEMYRAGTLSDIMDTIGKTRGTGDPTRVWDTPEMRRKLKMVFPGDEYARVEQAFKDIGTQSRTMSSLGGSRTAPMLGEDADLVGSLGTNLADVARGNAKIVAGRTVGNLLRRASLGASGPAVERHGAELLSQGDDLADVLRRVSQRRAGDPLRALNQITAPAAATSATYNLFGN